MNEYLDILAEDIKKNKVVLFLGSGFAYNAEHPKSMTPPLGKELGSLISEQFLGGNYKDSSLAYISDLAISQSNLFEVQEYIHNVFCDFSPNENHIKYASFPWKAIFTTNYDKILEKAYDEIGDNAIQELSVVYRNTPEQQIFKTPNTVPYYKLHGCISYINDPKLPLILSSEQYLTHRDNRQRLFNKFEELASDCSIVFIGYSNQDHNIRSILQRLESLKSARPRSYMISPNFSQIEISYWQERKISPINMGHEEFILEIDKRISENERKLSSFIQSTDREIEKKFSVTFQDVVPSESLLNFLDHESQFIHSSIPLGNTSPKEFYRGVLKNWDPIIRGLDVRRKIEDSILTDIILEDKYQKDNETYLFLLQGFAGSGKTVLLKRLAWEAAMEFDKTCIFINQDSALRSQPILELYSYVKERIYIFIDNLLDNALQLIDLIKKAERDEIPLSIISTERINQLNDEQTIEGYVSNLYTLNYLSETEVEKLIKKLEKHDSLGYLKNKTKEQRKRELAEKTGRVLLVALYEATGGRPFEEIIYDEYESLQTDELKAIYLTVAVFHRLNTKVRAGLISRIHNISFEEFKTKLFKPLDFIIFNEKDYRINDFVYSTRHPYIAQIIFELVLKDQQERYDEYIRILNHIDIDYSSDWSAFLDIINARNLDEIFNDPIQIMNIYDLALDINPDDPKLIQQRGIFHMISKSGSLYTSEKLLKQAKELAPDDVHISHSLAELALKKAESSHIDIEKKKYFETSRKLCREIIKKSKSHSFSYHTLLKIDFNDFKEALKLGINERVEKTVKQFERTLNEAKQFFPNETFILEVESRFNEQLNEKPQAISILKEAFEINKASPFISIRYAKLLDNNKDTHEAINALRATLELNPNDKNVNYQLARLISKLEPTNYEEISHYYRRSFTKGDTRFDSQFWYARSLFLKGDIKDAFSLFEQLGRARVAPKIKNSEEGKVLHSNGKIKLFKGRIERMESNFAFVRREKEGDDIFMFRSPSIKDWIDFRIGSKLEFNLAFNYKGPVVINPKLKASN